MALQLAEIAQAVAPGAHALVLLDQAGGPHARRLTIPAHITPVPLPAQAPELNPVENVWQFVRDTGCRSASSTPTRRSSTIAATPGISSSISPGSSCPSDCANGLIGSEQRDVVLPRIFQMNTLAG